MNDFSELLKWLMIINIIALTIYIISIISNNKPTKKGDTKWLTQYKKTTYTQQLKQTRD